MSAVLDVVGLLVLCASAALGLVLFFKAARRAEPAAAEAPDLDTAEVNARLAAILAVDEQLAGLRGLDLSSYYVLPEVPR